MAGRYAGPSAPCFCSSLPQSRGGVPSHGDINQFACYNCVPILLKLIKINGFELNQPFGRLFIIFIICIVRYILFVTMRDREKCGQKLALQVVENGREVSHERQTPRTSFHSNKSKNNPQQTGVLKQPLSIQTAE